MQCPQHVADFAPVWATGVVVVFPELLYVMLFVICWTTGAVGFGFSPIAVGIGVCEVGFSPITVGIGVCEIGSDVILRLLTNFEIDEFLPYAPRHSQGCF